MKKLFLFAILLLFTQLAQAQWEPDVRLTNDTVNSATGFCNQHAIAVYGDTIHIVWWDDFNNDPSYFAGEIFYIRSVDGGLTWEPEIQLTNSTDFLDSSSPTISVIGPIIQIAFQCIIVYQNITKYELYYLRSIDGGNSWGDTVRLTNFSGKSYYPCLAVSDSITHLVYDKSMSPWQYTDIYYKRSTDLGIT